MVGLAALLAFAPSTFALRAEALPSATRLRIRLSVTNLTTRPQTLWMATPDCTNSRWTASSPGVRIVDYSEDHTKTCMVACEHRRTLKTGETFVRTVEPRLYPYRRFVDRGRTIETGLRPGPLVLTVTLAQPNPATIDDRSLPETLRYRQLFTTSNPVRVVVKSTWLKG